MSDQVSLREKIAYGLGDSASNFFYQFIGFFGLSYYTDIFGLDAAAAGYMILAVRFLDAVVDPLVGIVADRTHSRWGKFRPYLLWGAVPYAVIGYVTFMNPAVPARWKLAYACVTYTLTWVVYSVVNIPYSALMGVMSESSAVRTSISSLRFTCAFVATFLLVTFLIPLRNWLGHGDAGIGTRRTILIFAVASAVLFFLCFRGTRERVKPVESAGNLRRDLRDLASNRAWWVLFALGLVLLTSIGVRNAMMPYYFKYVVANESLFPYFGGWGLGSFVAGTFLTKWLLKLGEGRSVLIALYIIVGALQTAFVFVSPHNFALLQILNVASNLAAGPQPGLLWAMYSDCAAFGEWKNRRRATGLVFSSAVFSQKAGIGVASGVAGLVLSATGFVANQVQGPAAVHGIAMLFTVVPGVLAIVSGGVVLLYPLKSDVMQTVERELAARKAAPA